MNITIEKKKEEAISRMEAMGLWRPIIENFQSSGKIFVSEAPMGAIYDLEPSLQKQVEEFENQYNGLVYAVIRAHLEFGQCDSLLYISDYEEEWEYDRSSLPQGIVMTYTINQDADWCSEFGSIGVAKGIAGGLVRIA